MKYKYVLIILFIISVLFILGSIGYKYLRNGNSINIEETTSTTVNNDVSLIDLPADSLEAKVLKYFETEYNKTIKDISMEISQSNDTFYRVTVKVKDVEEPYSVLAKYTGDGKDIVTWDIIYSGTGFPVCSVLDAVSFSPGIGSVCLDDTTQELKSRIEL